jgi:hypothetical protein
LIVVFLVSVFPSAYRPADFSMSIVFSVFIFPSVRRPAAAVFPFAACVRHLFAPHCIEEKRFL